MRFIYKFFFPSFISLCFIPLLSGIICSCDNKNNLNTKELSREIKERKIRKILPAEILENANTVGKEIVTTFTTQWKNTMADGLQNKGVEYSKKFCIVPFIPGYDSLVQRGIVIKKIGQNTRDLSKISNYETQIMQAYLYNVEKNLPSFENVQRMDSSKILFTSPIYVKDRFCMQCHQDDTKGFTSVKLNDYCGFWSVILPAKEVLQRIQ